MVVTYFLENPAVLHATRHQLGCGILKRALMATGQGFTSGGRGPGRFNNLRVWEDEVYAGLPESPWQSRLKSHSCCRKGVTPVTQPRLAGD